MSETTMYFRVRSIFKNGAQTTLTLNPVEWLRGDPDTADADGTFHEWHDAEPTDDGAEPYEPGGKTTELRFEGDHPAEVGDFLTLTVVPTEHSWPALEEADKGESR